ncbi:MAG: hypothetical protein KDA44_19955, partial [Planctomycetales bacterium]|nr:hypothetical protein [Planctomycetales bacterium]
PDAIRRWTWNAAQLMWGIALGWSGIVVFTGGGTLGLFAILIAVGLAVAAIRRRLLCRSRATTISK